MLWGKIPWISELEEFTDSSFELEEVQKQEPEAVLNTALSTPAHLDECQKQYSLHHFLKLEMKTHINPKHLVSMTRATQNCSGIS